MASRHIFCSIETLLKKPDDILMNMFDRNPSVLREELKEKLAKGEKYIGSEGCIGFDPVNGICPGHESLEEIAKSYHDRDILAGYTCEGQICKCCGMETVTTVSIEHDSRDFSKDLSICNKCYTDIYTLWKKNTPRKICPI
jgi:hypothetical protein